MFRFSQFWFRVLVFLWDARASEQAVTFSGWVIPNTAALCSTIPPGYVYLNSAHIHTHTHQILCRLRFSAMSNFVYCFCINAFSGLVSVVWPSKIKTTIKIAEQIDIHIFPVCRFLSTWKQWRVRFLSVQRWTSGLSLFFASLFFKFFYQNKQLCRHTNNRITQFEFRQIVHAEEAGWLNVKRARFYRKIMTNLERWTSGLFFSFANVQLSCVVKRCVCVCNFFAIYSNYGSNVVIFNEFRLNCVDSCAPFC